MPTESTDSGGGLGGPSDRAERWERRQHLGIIEAAVYQGWDIPPEAKQTIPRELLAIVNDPNASTRDRIRATECLAALTRDRIDAAVQLDKIGRLEAGSATERVELMETISDAQLEAVAKSISQSCAKPEKKPRKR